MQASYAERIKVSDNMNNEPQVRWRGRERTDIWNKSLNFIQSQHSSWCCCQASSYGQKDNHEDKLNHFPLGSKLQSKWPDREAKVLIDHLVQMMEH